MIEPDYWIKANINAGNLGDLDIKNVNPASVDIILGQLSINNSKPYDSTPSEISGLSPRFSIGPDDDIICCSKENIKCPLTHAWMFTLKSSIGRRGLVLSHTGWGDPGFEGQITFRLLASGSLSLAPGERIGQIVYMKMTGVPERGYKGRYQNSHGIILEKEDCNG